MTKNFKIIITVLSVITALCLLAAGIIMAVGLRPGGSSGDSGNKPSYTDKGESLEAALERMKSEKAGLEAKISELEAKLADSGKYFEDEIASLELAVAEKEAAIATLEADIAKYQAVFTIDVRAQAKLIDEIVNFIENKCPYVMVPVENEEDTAASEDTTEDDIVEYEWKLISDLIAEEREALGDEVLFTPEELEKSGLSSEELTEKLLRERVLAREDVKYPSVSIYYEDLATGYHFDYEADKLYNAASVIKAPYILSVLKVISADEAAFFERLEKEGLVPEKIDTDEDGIPDKTVIEYSDPSYDLTEVVVFDKSTMARPGSGSLKNAEDGTEFTYIDFIKYTLEESDNTAYQQLRSRFGYETMQNLARTLKANSIFKGGNSMSAADAGKLFKAIYEFTEEDEKYGALMAESMSKAGHTVIIPAGVYPTKNLHKYGWDTDSYHDAAVVLYKDKPYVLSVFTDLDIGGNEVNAYLQGIVKLISKLHMGFYSNS